jgi:hypothetical protein
VSVGLRRDARGIGRAQLNVFGGDRAAMHMRKDSE